MIMGLEYSNLKLIMIYSYMIIYIYIYTMIMELESSMIYDSGYFLVDC